MLTCILYCSFTSQTSSLEIASEQDKSVIWQSASQEHGNRNHYEGQITLMRRAGLEQDLNLHPVPEMKEQAVPVPLPGETESSNHQHHLWGMHTDHRPAMLPPPIVAGHGQDSRKHVASSLHSHISADFSMRSNGAELTKKPRRSKGEWQARDRASERQKS